MQAPTCAARFTNDMSKSDWTWHKLWIFSTINLKYKYFHNSVDWSSFYLQVHIPSWLAKILRFTFFRLPENAFVNISNCRAPCRTAPISFLRKHLSPICHEKLWEKGPTVLYGRRYYALAPLENHVVVYAPSIFGRKWGLKDNILNLTKRIVWQNSSVDWGVV